MEEEIEKVSGIGTVTEAAEKAVEAFGEKTLEELAEENKISYQTGQYRTCAFTSIAGK